jgi:O-antigen ligase
MSTYRAPYWEEDEPLAPPSARRNGRFGPVDLFLFVAPLVQFVQLQVIGVLSGTDILLLLAFPLVVLRNLRLLRQRHVFMILLLGIGWFISQVITDLIRDTPPVDFLRGWSKIGLTLTHFTTIYLLTYRSRRRFLLFGFGFIAGQLLTLRINPGVFFAASPWKFGYCGPVTLVVFLLTSTLPYFRRRKMLVLLAAVAIALINLFMGARGVALISLLAGIYAFFLRRAGAVRLRGSRLLFTLGVVLLSGWIFMSFYSYLAQSGELGATAQSQYETQGSGEGGVLLGGRSEILSSAMAIFDSPIIGHGSWARDPKYKFILEERRRELGYARVGVMSDDLIPTHSHIFGAWVEAGVMGAVFWFYIFCIVLRIMMKAPGSEPILPICIFVSIAMLWNIFFSPYGADMRVVFAYFAAGILLLDQLRRDQPGLPRPGSHSGEKA